MKTYIGVDLGTSSIKLSLINSNGVILNEVSESYPLFQDGLFSEQNPSDWWNAFETSIDKLLINQNHKDVEGMSFSGQMHGLVMLDEFDKIIRPCILWNDGRSYQETDFINKSFGHDKLNNLTGNIAYAGFTAPKIMWVKNNEKHNFLKINKIMLPKDYLVYRLTGQFVTDYSDASGTLLLDCKNKCWSEEMLKFCDVKSSQLPTLHESYDVIGIINDEFKNKHHLGDVKVVMGAGDNAAASIGMGVIKQGEVNISLGTSGTIFIPTDHFVKTKKNELHSFANVTGKWHLMGCILTAASARKWWLEDVLKTNDYQEDELDVKNSNSNGLYFLPYLSGERSPHNDVNARGAFIGLSHNTTKGDMSKAIIEGVSFALKDCLEIAKKEGFSFNKATICGGGSKSNQWCQLMANILNLNIYVGDGSPSLGAALIAVKGCENISFEEACESIEYKKEFRPELEIVKYYEDKYEIFVKLYPALKCL